MYKLDLAILRAINHYRIRALDPLLLAITDSTFLVSILIPTAFLIVGLIWHRKSLLGIAATLYLADLIVSIVVKALKYGVNRTRPFVHHDFIEKLSNVVTPSFPSGHTTDAFVMAFGISLVTRKAALQVPVWIWACAVGYSRMALGVHYPSDVLASIMLSFLAALTARWLYGYIRTVLKTTHSKQ